MTLLDTRNTVYIMCDAFSAEQLKKLSRCIEARSHRCSFFEGPENLHAVLGQPNAALLLLSTKNHNLRELIRIVGSESGKRNVPIVVYCKQLADSNKDVLLAPEINDFLLDPLNLKDVCLRVERLMQQFKQKQGLSVITQRDDGFEIQQLIGKSPVFTSLIEKLVDVGASDVNVLLTGETGTGKELCARAIHNLSARAAAPFVPVNCGAIPPELFENEMFGHEEGAFTDARRSHAGLIAEAQNGTLLLDEIDTLPLQAQVKFLRFLQDKIYKPLGGTRYRHSNVRVIAATNHDLLQKVHEGTFRVDLYYRLRVVCLDLPSLRDRPEDILLLAEHFLKNSATTYGSSAKRFSAHAVEKLLQHDWRGNVRELENIIHEAAILAKGPVVHARNLNLIPHQQPSVEFTDDLKGVPFKVAKSKVVESFERDYLSHVVAVCGGNISRAARLAQKDRRTFFSLLKKHGLASKQKNQ